MTTAHMQTETNVKTKIIIVEDDPLISDMVSQKLSNAGFDTKSIIDGASALAEISLFVPSVVILDLMLPNMSGEEILKELRSQSIYDDTKVIVFTNKSRDENESIVKELGADAYLVKASTDLNTLLKNVQEFLE